MNVLCICPAGAIRASTNTTLRFSYALRTTGSNKDYVIGDTLAYSSFVIEGNNIRLLRDIEHVRLVRRHHYNVVTERGSLAYHLHRQRLCRTIEISLAIGVGRVKHHTEGLHNTSIEEEASVNGLSG